MNYRSLPIAAILLFTVNCTRPLPQKPANTDNAVVDLPVEVKNTDGLNGSQKDILVKISEHKAVSFAAITQLMIKKHVNAHLPKGKDAEIQKTQSEIQSFISKIAPNKNTSPAKTKIYYETAIKAQHGQKDMVYNIDKSNIVDIYAENKMQCYSGTYLYEVVRRQVGGQSFRSGNEVVIFQAGHVLPGYMVKDKDGFRLIGLETTQVGGARRDFGPANSLKDMRVVDAEMFAVTEVFADNIKNLDEVAAAAVRNTAKKYGIKLETSLDDGGISNEAIEETKRQLNQSIFAFGQPADTTPGDRERTDSGDDGDRPDLLSSSNGNTVAVKHSSLVWEVLGMNCSPLEGHYESGIATLDIYAKDCENMNLVTNDPSAVEATYSTQIMELQFAVKPLSADRSFLFILGNGTKLEVAAERIGPFLNLHFANNRKTYTKNGPPQAQAYWGQTHKAPTQAADSN